MSYASCMKTVMGGLSLLLVLSACSSGSKSRSTAASSPPTTDSSAPQAKAAAPPPVDMPRSDNVTDRGTTRGPSYEPTERANLSDREIAAACPSKLDAQGNRAFDDPTCPDRYRRQMGNVSEKDLAGLATACPSKLDAAGKAIYDDPTCPDRYRRQQMGATSMGATSLAAACPSRVDANGKIIYNDPTCPDRYRRQMDSAALATACPSRVDANGNVVYEDPACPARSRYLTQESAYYDRYADKAAKHARAAEIAANQGNIPDMIQNAEISLDHAKEARRAGNNADLAAGIVALRETIALGQGNELSDATSSIREARVNLSRAAGIKTWDTPPGGEPARPTRAAAVPPPARTVKGELSRNTDMTSGKESYVLRDPQVREMPITLSPEMSQQVQVGDTVEAQVDSAGHVTSINKSQ